MFTLDDSKPPQVIAQSISFAPRLSPRLVFLPGTPGEVTIHPDGRIDYQCTADEAAKSFWEAVEKLGFKRAAPERS